MGYYDFVLLQSIKRFIKKHKIITFLLILFFIFSFKKCFCLEKLDDSYPNMDFLSRVNYDATTGIYSLPSNNNKSYCDSYCILYTTNNGGRFNIVFFPSGMYVNNNLNAPYGHFKFPRESYDTSLGVPSSSYNYFNLEYNASGTFRSVLNSGGRYDTISGWWQYVVYSTATINNQNGVPIILAPTPTRVPSFLNSNNFSDLDFDTLDIDPGTYDTTLIFRLIDQTENRRLIDIYFIDGEYDDFMEREDLENPFSNLVYKIPLENLPAFNYTNGHSYRWQLIYDEVGSQKYVNVDVTASVSANVNEVTNGDIQNSINETNSKIDETNEQLQETNNQLSDLNDNLTSSDISSTSASDLPSVSVNDPTENGIGSIFQNMYNAFCTGNAQDIVFPIPFVNKNITLSPNYIYNMLYNNNADWVITFIQAFWAFLFGRFIIKDMASKIMKIKNGNIENLQNENIKMEMM